MSATRDLIAAALTAAGSIRWQYPELADDMRELCARAMVEPDIGEVKNLVSAACNLMFDAGKLLGRRDAGADREVEDARSARTALLDYVRGVMAERDALIADNERLSGLYEQAVKGRAPAPTACRTGMENEMTKEIEVIDQYNARHRFPVEGHYYEWRLKPGTIDVEGTDFLDVFRRGKDDEEEFELIATFPRPARVGIVTDATCLALPMRELQMEQCPRCGYVTKPTAEKLK